MRRELQEREKDECVPRIFSVCHFRVCKRFGSFKARLLGSLDVVLDCVDTTLAKIYQAFYFSHVRVQRTHKLGASVLMILSGVSSGNTAFILRSFVVHAQADPPGPSSRRKSPRSRLQITDILAALDSSANSSSIRTLPKQKSYSPQPRGSCSSLLHLQFNAQGRSTSCSSYLSANAATLDRS